MQQYVIFNVLKEYCISKEEEERSILPRLLDMTSYTSVFPQKCFP